MSLSHKKAISYEIQKRFYSPKKIANNNFQNNN